MEEALKLKNYVEFKIVEKFMLIDGKYQYIGVYGLDDKLL